MDDAGGVKGQASTSEAGSCEQRCLLEMMDRLFARSALWRFRFGNKGERMVALVPKVRDVYGESLVPSCHQVLGLPTVHEIFVSCVFLITTSRLRL